ncbi:hypothetical protein [Pedobacter sp. GR22-10]|uniref:hypothetical protein n=1 Tax=Pedobacter sp. GR22-10 TaxID=2994472 RepID=UPI002245C34E|nr:hypothetical protein [Pedobacter sp. GR22-10]MCX2429851.1 hypothetical protein [Pedobacter sp. GR22-10]
MVLIHSRQTDDTTVEIIQWLFQQGKSIFRANVPRDIKYVQKAIDQSTLDSVYMNGLGMIYHNLEIDNDELRSQTQNYIAKDIEILWTNLFEQGLAGLRTFGTLPFSNNSLSKLNVLLIAKSLELTVPPFEIIYTKNRLKEVKDKWKRIICKGMAEGISIMTKEVMIFGQRTEEITSDAISDFPDSFSPTFVQKLIDKAFELRVFFFNHQIHSLACFTQANKISQIDGRTVDAERPQRRVVFNLPEDLKVKITMLAEKLKLNYGSFDFIVTPDHEFYFLEVNPYGQYGFLSKHGNFYLEKAIAEFL